MINPNKFIFPQNLSNLTEHARHSLFRSSAIAKISKAKEVTSLHLLYSIFLEKGSLGANILSDLGIKKEHFPKIVSSLKKTSHPESDFTLPLSPNLKKVITKAYLIAKEMTYSYVGTEHLAYALLESREKELIPLIKKAKKNKKNQPPTKLGFPENRISDTKPMDSLPELPLPEGNIPSGMNEFLKFIIPEAVLPGATKNDSSTPYLDKFCQDINLTVAEKKESLIGRDKELERIIQILGRKNKRNPLLIGQPGVGKTALVYKLAEMIQEEKIPSFLIGKRILNLDIASLIAGTSFRGEFEMRLKEIIRELINNPDTILFIDEIHNISGAGNTNGSLDLANIIKPALSRGEIQIIGATTQEEFKKYFEKDAALERRFQIVPIQEPSEEETKQILMGIKKNYEVFHNVIISPPAISLAVELSGRYILNRFFPDKAIDVLDEAASFLRTKSQLPDFRKEIKSLEKKKELLLNMKESLVVKEQYEKAIELRTEEEKIGNQLKEMQKKQEKVEQDHQLEVNPSEIIETVARISHIPQAKIAQSSQGKIRDIREKISTRIVGQEEAIKKIARVLLRSHLGISNPHRPLGSFLFLGPSGVGKTETAKILAEEFFEKKNSFIRIDMSEFMERHSVSSLIGSPAGYVGYGEGGRLTEKVRHNPYSLILFDEIEKAHPDVHNLLLQILEDGQLTDSQGTEISFKNTIIILTSNIETEGLDEIPKIGFLCSALPKGTRCPVPQKTINNATLREIQKKLRPELVNRLDNIILFRDLVIKDLEKIASLELEKLKRRLKKNGFQITINPKISAFLAKISHEENQGARLVRKNVQDLIEEKIAEKMIEEKIKGNRIKVEINKEQLEIK